MTQVLADVHTIKERRVVVRDRRTKGMVKDPRYRDSGRQSVPWCGNQPRIWTRSFPGSRWWTTRMQAQGQDPTSRGSKLQILHFTWSRNAPGASRLDAEPRDREIVW